MAVRSNNFTMRPGAGFNQTIINNVYNQADNLVHFQSLHKPLDGGQTELLERLAVFVQGYQDIQHGLWTINGKQIGSKIDILIPRSECATAVAHLQRLPGFETCRFQPGFQVGTLFELEREAATGTTTPNVATTSPAASPVRQSQPCGSTASAPASSPAPSPVRQSRPPSASPAPQPVARAVSATPAAGSARNDPNPPASSPLSSPPSSPVGPPAAARAASTAPSSQQLPSSSATTILEQLEQTASSTNLGRLTRQGSSSRRGRAAASPFNGMPGKQIEIDGAQWIFLDLGDPTLVDIDTLVDCLPLFKVSRLKTSNWVNLIGFVAKVGVLVDNRGQKFWPVTLIGYPNSENYADVRLFPQDDTIAVGATIDLQVNDVLIVLSGRMYNRAISCYDTATALVARSEARAAAAELLTWVNAPETLVNETNNEAEEHQA